MKYIWIEPEGNKELAVSFYTNSSFKLGDKVYMKNGYAVKKGSGLCIGRALCHGKNASYEKIWGAKEMIFSIVYRGFGIPALLNDPEGSFNKLKEWKILDMPETEMMKKLKKIINVP